VICVLFAVALGAVLLVLVYEYRLNSRLHRQLRNEQQAYLEARERAVTAETELNRLRRVKGSQS
jgi:hypothetical protein